MEKIIHYLVWNLHSNTCDKKEDFLRAGPMIYTRKRVKQMFELDFNTKTEIRIPVNFTFDQGLLMNAPTKPVRRNTLDDRRNLAGDTNRRSILKNGVTRSASLTSVIDTHVGVSNDLRDDPNETIDWVPTGWLAAHSDPNTLVF